MPGVKDELLVIATVAFITHSSEPFFNLTSMYVIQKKPNAIFHLCDGTNGFNGHRKVFHSNQKTKKSSVSTHFPEKA